MSFRLKLLPTKSETHTQSVWRYLLWPTQHGEGEESGGEPSIEDISICGPHEGKSQNRHTAEMFNIQCMDWTLKLLEAIRGLYYRNIPQSWTKH